jgi:hypothetical protein
MQNTKDYQKIWDDFYFFAHNTLINLEKGQEVLSTIIQIRVKNLDESFVRKVSRLKVQLYDFDIKYRDTENYMTMVVRDLINKLEDLEQNCEINNYNTVQETLDPEEERKYMRLWESYKLNSNVISSSALSVFNGFEQYKSYKTRCKMLEEQLSMIGEIVSSVSSYDLALTRLAITKVWNFETDANSDIFDFLLRFSIAIEQTKINNVQAISKADAFNMLYNNAGRIEVLQDIVRIINYRYHYSSDNYDVSWEDMKFCFYNLMNLKEFWDHVSTFSMARWNATSIHLHQSIGV